MKLCKLLIDFWAALTNAKIAAEGIPCCSGALRGMIFVVVIEVLL
jgi:hypothetical protein